MLGGEKGPKPGPGLLGRQLPAPEPSADEVKFTLGVLSEHRSLQETC